MRIHSILMGNAVLLVKKIVNVVEIMPAVHVSQVTHLTPSIRTALLAPLPPAQGMWVVLNAAIKLLRLLLSVLNALI